MSHIAAERALARRLKDEAALSRPRADARLQMRIMRAVDECRDRGLPRGVAHRGARLGGRWSLAAAAVAAIGAVAAGVVHFRDVNEAAPASATAAGGPAAAVRPPVMPGVRLAGAALRIAGDAARDDAAVDELAGTLLTADALGRAAAELDAWAESPLNAPPLGDLDHDAAMATQLVLAPLPLGAVAADGW